MSDQAKPKWEPSAEENVKCRNCGHPRFTHTDRPGDKPSSSRVSHPTRCWTGDTYDGYSDNHCDAFEEPTEIPPRVDIHIIDGVVDIHTHADRQGNSRDVSADMSAVIAAGYVLVRSDELEALRSDRARLSCESIELRNPGIEHDPTWMAEKAKRLGAS